MHKGGEMGEETVEIRGEILETPEYFTKIKVPYEAALKQDVGSMKEFYKTKPGKTLSDILTISRDTHFHIAAYKGNEKMLQTLFEMLPQEIDVREVLTQKDIHGNTPLHEVATTDNVKAAELLVGRLLARKDGKISVQEKDIRERENLLKLRNNFGETALFRAAANGRKKMLQYLVKEVEHVGDIREHYYRNDQISILHIAIIGQHFDTALWLLKRERTLGLLKEKSGMTCLQLLASMPKAFKSSSQIKGLKLFVYICLPSNLRESNDDDYDDDDDEFDQPLSQKGEDIERGIRSNSFKKSVQRSIPYREVALWLLRNNAELLSPNEERNYMIFSSLCLLASMPRAFKSSCLREGLEAFIYNCLPKLLHGNKDDDQEQKDKQSNFVWRFLSHLNIFKAIPKLYRLFWETLAEEYKMVKVTKELKEKHKLANELAKILVEKDTSWTASHKMNDNIICIGEDQNQASKLEFETQERTGDNIIYTSSTKKATSSLETPLLIAASKGIQEIVSWTFKTYPQAIEHVNSTGQNILHVAVRYRQPKIFSMVRDDDITAVERLAVTIDNNGYTILHHAADTSCYNGGTQPGAALQLQEELEWFAKVKKLIPSHYEMHRNKDGVTAEKLFEDSHDAQYNEAKEWVQSIAQSCSTVAVLVATVVFAAAFTVPGGFRGEQEEGNTNPNKEEGLPILLERPLYSLFTVMDVASLAASLTSLVLFLSILTSSMEKKDFYRTLPRRLTFAFNFLFFSVATAMLAFTSTILLTIQPRNSLVKTLNYVAAFIPIAVFVMAQYPLYVAFYRTLRSSFRQICKIILPKKCENLLFKHRKGASMM